ncbi:MAG: hypothetical protein U0234_05525 [Sandaracinus sp.]
MRRRGPPDESATVPNARPFVEGEPELPAEDVFASFLQRAYARKEGRPGRSQATTEWERSVEELLPREPAADEDEPRDTEPPPPPDASAADVESLGDEEPAVRTVEPDGTVRVVLLTRKKTLPPGAVAAPTDDDEPVDTRGATAVASAEKLQAALRASRAEIPLPLSQPRRSRPPAAPEPDLEPEWASVVPPPSEATQRREAKKLVPDLATKKDKPKPAREASEDGLIPSGELDRKLSDMAVLLRYGHEEQVARELEGLRRTYPQDLLLLRSIGEFWADNGRKERALETLFALASGLFERRNVEGMRQALEQAKRLDPESERAHRLLSLLDARPDGTPLPRK